MFSVVRNEIIR